MNIANCRMKSRAIKVGITNYRVKNYGCNMELQLSAIIKILVYQFYKTNEFVFAGKFFFCFVLLFFKFLYRTTNNQDFFSFLRLLDIFLFRCCLALTCSSLFIYLFITTMYTVHLFGYIIIFLNL